MKYHMHTRSSSDGWLRLAALSVSVLLLTGTVRAGEERLQRLVKDIQSGPTAFYTSAALDYLAARGGPAAQTLMPDDIKAANTALQATIALGDMGTAAMPAVGVLIDRFPKGIDVLTSEQSYSATDGSFEDWMMTKVMGEKNKFLFSAPFLDYASLHKCSQFLDIQHEAVRANEQYGSGGKLLSAQVTIHVTFTFYAGACALTTITGRDLGTDQQRWRTYWAREGAHSTSTTATPPSSPTPSPTVSTPTPATNTAHAPTGKVETYVLGGTYRFSLTTGDNFTGRVESKTDTTLIVDSEDGNGYSFRTAIVRASELVSLPEKLEKKGHTGSGMVEAEILTFDELKRRSPVGVRLELSIKSGQTFEGRFTAIDGENIKIDVDGSSIPIHKDVVTQIATVPAQSQQSPKPTPVKQKKYTGPLDTIIVRNPKIDEYGRRLASLVYAGVIVKDYRNTVTLEKTNGTTIDLNRDDIERIIKHSTASNPSIEPIKRYAMPLECPGGMVLVDVPPMPGSNRPFFKTCIDQFEFPNARNSMPKRGISFEEAQALCEQQGKRLCTTDEWQHSCAGKDDFAYPYGKSFNETKCNTAGAKGVKPSGTKTGCVNKRGLYDMCGNVFEWVINREGNPMLMGGPLSKCQTVSPGLDGRAKPLTGLRCCKSN